MIPSCSPVICPPKIPKPCWPLIAPSLRKLWFSEGPVFWQKYSNGPGVAKSWHMTKVTIRCHKRCVKLSRVQIWQKKFQWEVSQIADNRFPCMMLLGGLSVNLNHLKSCCGHQLWTMTYLSKYHTFDPPLYLGCQMLQTHFFKNFFWEKQVK